MAWWSKIILNYNPKRSPFGTLLELHGLFKELPKIIRDEYTTNNRKVVSDYFDRISDIYSGDYFCQRQLTKVKNDTIFIYRNFIIFIK